MHLTMTFLVAQKGIAGEKPLLKGKLLLKTVVPKGLLYEPSPPVSFGGTCKGPRIEVYNSVLISILS